MSQKDPIFKNVLPIIDLLSESEEKKLFEELKKLEKISCVLVEPIQGECVVIPGSKIFFKSLRDICDKYNSLLILDEVQSGVGRTGKMWGYENLGIEPDGFTLA